MPVLEAPSQYEIERGKPMPSHNHSYVQTLLSVQLFKYRSKFTIHNELSLDLGGWKANPDICLYPKHEIDWLRDSIRVTDPPLLAVEIASPTQGMGELVEKVMSYLDAGVKSCWVVQPAFRSIAVFKPGENKPKVFTEGELSDSILDLTIDLTEVFG